MQQQYPPQDYHALYAPAYPPGYGPHPCFAPTYSSSQGNGVYYGSSQYYSPQSYHGYYWGSPDYYGQYPSHSSGGYREEAYGEYGYGGGQQRRTHTGQSGVSSRSRGDRSGYDVANYESREGSEAEGRDANIDK